MTCEANEDGVTEEGIYFEAYDIVADQGAHGYWVRRYCVNGRMKSDAISFYKAKSGDGSGKNVIGADISKPLEEGYDSYSNPKGYDVAKNERYRRRVDFSKAGYTDEQAWAKMQKAAIDIYHQTDENGNQKVLEYEAVVILPGKKKAQNSNSGAFTIFRAVGRNSDVDGSKALSEDDIIPDGVSKRQFVGRGNDLLQNPNIRYYEPKKRGDLHEKNDKWKTAESSDFPLAYESKGIGEPIGGKHQQLSSFQTHDLFGGTPNLQRQSGPPSVDQTKQHLDPVELVATAYTDAKLSEPKSISAEEQSPQFSHLLTSMMQPRPSQFAEPSQFSVNNPIENLVRARAGLPPTVKFPQTGNKSKTSDQPQIRIKAPSLAPQLFYQALPYVNDAGAVQLPTGRSKSEQPASYFVDRRQLRRGKSSL